MKKTILIFVFGFLFFASCTDNDDSDKMISQRITDGTNSHQAFTDLVFFDNQFFLVYRESNAHAYGNDGIIKLLRKIEGGKWDLLKEFTVSGVDLRDPKFSVNGNQLMLYIHGSRYTDNKIVAFSDYRLNYSENWSNLENVLIENSQTTKGMSGNEAWPWRVSWFEGKAYTIGYYGINIFNLYSSNNGLLFNNMQNLKTLSGFPNESTIRFSKKGDCFVLIRREFETALFGKFDIKKGEFVFINDIPIKSLGGPDFVIVNEDKILFTGRENKKLILCEYDLSMMQYRKLLTLPSGGDCGYAGMVIKDDMLWISYYSSHETKNGSSIYVAKIKIEELGI